MNHHEWLGETTVEAVEAFLCAVKVGKAKESQAGVADGLKALRKGRNRKVEIAAVYTTSRHGDPPLEFSHFRIG